MKHPLANGTRIVSLRGEMDTDGETDEERHAAPGEIGIILGHEDHGFHEGSQGISYSVVFYPSRVWVFLDQHEVEDPSQYTVLDTVEDELWQLVQNYLDVMEDYDAGFPINRPEHPHHDDWLRASKILDWLAARKRANDEEEAS